MTDIRIKRVYDDPAKADGYRVLVDRLWPRGVKKVDLDHDEWLKEVAPSDELRKWFGHDPDRFGEFKKRYAAELKGSDALADLRRIGREHATVTLLYGAKDTEHNQAVVLRSLMKK
jgi:uncharacterized protein YeaO (DUF488 family)